MFSKFFKEKSVDELIALAADLQVDGFDLCVRPGYPVNPDNAAPRRCLRPPGSCGKPGLSIPMITGNFDLLTPDHPTAAPILAAMDKADVRFIKLGYFTFDPLTQEGFWAEVDRIRRAFDGSALRPEIRREDLLSHPFPSLHGTELRHARRFAAAGSIPGSSGHKLIPAICASRGRSSRSPLPFAAGDLSIVGFLGRAPRAGGRR